MEAMFKLWAGYVALFLEGIAVVVITFGGIQALWGIIRTLRGSVHRIGNRRSVWLEFGMWLLLGIEFELAADIVRTVIAPSWEELGQLAAIAVIRTFLNFFLERDLEKYAELTKSDEHRPLSTNARETSLGAAKREPANDQP